MSKSIDRQQAIEAVASVGADEAMPVNGVASANRAEFGRGYRTARKDAVEVLQSLPAVPSGADVLREIAKLPANHIHVDDPDYPFSRVGCVWCGATWNLNGKRTIYDAAQDHPNVLNCLWPRALKAQETETR